MWRSDESEHAFKSIPQLRYDFKFIPQLRCEDCKCQEHLTAAREN